MIRQCAILFGCLALGELIVFLTDIKLPSSIIGMLLLTLFLKLGWIKLHWVQGMSDLAHCHRIVNQHSIGACCYRVGSPTNA